MSYPYKTKFLEFPKIPVFYENRCFSAIFRENRDFLRKSRIFLKISKILEKSRFSRKIEVFSKKPEFWEIPKILSGRDKTKFLTWNFPIKIRKFPDFIKDFIKENPKFAKNGQKWPFFTIFAKISKNLQKSGKFPIFNKNLEISRKSRNFWLENLRACAR